MAPIINKPARQRPLTTPRSRNRPSTMHTRLEGPPKRTIPLQPIITATIRIQVNGPEHLTRLHNKTPVILPMRGRRLTNPRQMLRHTKALNTLPRKEDAARGFGQLPLGPVPTRPHHTRTRPRRNRRERCHQRGSENNRHANTTPLKPAIVACLRFLISISCASLSGIQPTLPWICTSPPPATC